MKARRASKAQFRARLAAKRLRRVVGLGQVVLGKLAHAFLAVDGEKDCRHERNEGLVGADVRRRLFAADVLLARGQRQYESAIPCPVDSLAREPARHLPHELLLGCDHTAEWSAIAKRHAERLRLHGNDIGLNGRAHDGQRDGFRYRNDQKRAFRMRDGRDGRNVLNDAEEVRALDKNGCGFFGDGRVQRLQVDAASLRIVANERRRQALMLRVSGEHLAIFRVNGRGDDGVASA